MPSYAWIVSTGEKWLNITQRVFVCFFLFILTIYTVLNDVLMRATLSLKLKGRGPGINSSQSKNVGKIQLSMQLSHLSIIFENMWF